MTVKKAIYHFRAGKSSGPSNDQIRCTNPTDMLYCFDDVTGREIGRLSYWNFSPHFINVWNIRFDKDLTEEKQGKVTRDLLEYLRYIAPDGGIPRLSLMNKIYGDFWPALENDRLIRIDCFVRRMTEQDRKHDEILYARQDFFTLIPILVHLTLIGYTRTALESPVLCGLELVEANGEK
jgi:hypothetical protein